MKQITVINILDYNPNKLGGTEEYTIRLSQRLKEKGWKSILVYSEMPPENLYRLFEESGAELVVLNRQRLGNLRYHWELFKLIRKDRPDIVHTIHFPFYNLIPLIIRLAGSKNIFISEWTTESLKRQALIKKCLNILRNRLYNILIARVIAISRCVLKNRIAYSVGIDSKKMVLIYGSINLERFLPKRDPSLKKELNIPEENYVITAISHLVEIKGMDYLLYATPEILMAIPNVTFLIVGYGKEKERLMRLTEELNIKDRVIFTGTRSDTERILNITDIFVMPSICEEAFGFVGVEAMACGVPVVASCIGGIPEVVENETTGILVPPRDAPAITQACIKLLKDQNLREKMGEAGRKRAEELFDLNQMVNKIIDLYERSLECYKGE